MPKQNKQNVERKTISDAQLKSEIIKLFTKGQTGKTELLGILRKRFKIGTDRYLSTYDKVHSEWATLKAKGESEAIVNGAIEAANSGLKSKLQKAIELQNEIERIDKQLRGEIEFTFAIGNKINKSHNGAIFMLPVQVQNELRKIRIAFVSELNRMEGDYAPAKILSTGVTTIKVVYEEDGDNRT